MARLPLTKSLGAVKQFPPPPPPNSQKVEAGGSADAESFHLAGLPSGPRRARSSGGLSCADLQQVEKN